MLNFTVGPVMSGRDELAVTGRSAPYFRTPEFSKNMLESEEMMLDLLSAPTGSRCVFLTSSGTGAMESVVMNVLCPSDHVAVINGGSFGQRFVDLCRLHECIVEEVKVAFGARVEPCQLEEIPGDVTALVVNMHETSSGSLYDMKLLSSFCKKRGILLIVDAISAFIADEIDMEKLEADVVITGSQKALACHPGVAIVVLSTRAQDRVNGHSERCLYLSLKQALTNGVRGQTPWTPAVATLLQIHTRLQELVKKGIASERAEIIQRADEFRSLAERLGYQQVPASPSNAVTALWSPNCRAREIIDIAKSQYGIWLCPNGGKHADDVFRVGHIGYITESDQKQLLLAFDEIASKLR